MEKASMNEVAQHGSSHNTAVPRLPTTLQFPGCNSAVARLPGSPTLQFPSLPQYCSSQALLVDFCSATSVFLYFILLSLFVPGSLSALACSSCSWTFFRLSSAILCSLDWKLHKNREEHECTLIGPSVGFTDKRSRPLTARSSGLQCRRRNLVPRWLPASAPGSPAAVVAVPLAGVCVCVCVCAHANP